MNEPIQVKVPFENANDPTAKIVDWKVVSGSKVKEGDIVVELETTKTTFPVLAAIDGFVEHALPVGEEVPVGENLFRIHSTEISAITRAVPELKTIVSATDTTAPAVGVPIISKRAQELMAANGIDSSAFAGMSSVKESDVRQKLEALGKPGLQPVAESKPPAPPKFAENPGVMIPLTRAKLVENRELLAANREALKSAIYYFCPAAGFQETCARQSPPVQRMVVILFELVKLLKEYPSLNAYCADDAAFHYHHFNLGFAVDMGRGLKVLVIHEAEKMSFPELAEKVEDLLVKYMTDSLAVKEITGSTFTVTDLAQAGVFTFEPLINVHQAAILGIGAEVGLPGANSAGFMLNCVFDHRLNSGKLVAAFMGELSSRLIQHNELLKAAAPPEPLCCSRCLRDIGELQSMRAFLVPSTAPQGHICSICLTGY